MGPNLAQARCSIPSDSDLFSQRWACDAGCPATLQRLIEKNSYWNQVERGIYALNENGYSTLIRKFGVNDESITFFAEYEFEREYKNHRFSAVVQNSKIKAKIDGKIVSGVHACKDLRNLGVKFKVESISGTSNLLNWIIRDNDYSWRILNYQSNTKEKIALSYTRQDEDEELISKLFGDSYTSLTSTQRESITQTRIGQQKFRSDLINYWGSCAITGCKTMEILKASHIKPWRFSTNSERLDPYNGILLIPNLDSAFDNGLISFDDNGKIMISNSLSKEEIDILGFHIQMKLSKIESAHKKYLSYHRENIFR